MFVLQQYNIQIDRIVRCNLTMNAIHFWNWEPNMKICRIFSLDCVTALYSIHQHLGLQIQHFFCQLLFDKLMDNSLCSCSRLYFCFSLKRASTIFPYTTCLDCFRPFLICSVLAGKHLWRITLANRSLLVLSPSGWHMKNFYMTTFYLLFDSLNVKYCLVNQSSNSSS